jgi:CheY-like chemotaxis protein
MDSSLLAPLRLCDFALKSPGRRSNARKSLIFRIISVISAYFWNRRLQTVAFFSAGRNERQTKAHPKEYCLPTAQKQSLMLASQSGFMKTQKSAQLEPDPKGKVFVVDDNALLVEFAATVLTTAGYDVQSFSDPKAVLRAIHDTGPKPAVLVTDYEMGEMNGLELIQSSQQILPSIKTLLVSGTVDASITLSHTAKVDRFLGKPYDPAQLEKIVAELMQM